jgi:hypothetical protein
VPHASNSEAESARAMRGPWWWRLRCWATDRLAAATAALDPDDRSSTHWYEDDGQTIVFAQIRRPR